MTKRCFASVTATALVALLPALASAQDFDLGTIIVSGGFTPVDAARYGRSVSVVTGEDLEDRGITTVQNALRVVPGLSVHSSGASYTQVRIRGAESNHTLILIDGVEAAGGDGEYILTGLETANIERIEVLRGPQSVFYGSNASAGVVNIITKSGGDGTRYGGAVEYGNGWSANAHVSTRGDRGGLSFTLSRTDDEGWDYSNDGGEKDGIRRTSLGLKGDWAATDQLTFGIVARTSDEDYDFDESSFSATNADNLINDDTTKMTDREERQLQLWAEFDAMGGQMMHRVSAERTDFYQIAEAGTFNEYEIDMVTEVLKYQLSYGLDGQPVDAANHVLTAMLEWQRDESVSNATYLRESVSAAAEYRASLDNGLDLQLGARFDDNKQFANHWTWNAGLSYGFDNGVRVHASAGAGVVNPSYLQLFGNPVWAYVGNPDLLPEENRGFDIGVEVPFANGRGLVDVTLFREALKNEISTVYDPATFSTTYFNQTGNSDRQGVELSANLQATDVLDLRLGYTWLDATNPDGSVEVRRPKHELSLGATLEVLDGRGAISADLRHVSGNYATQFWGGFSTAKLPEITTLDLSGRYDLTDSVALTARVTNLLDDRNSEAWGYAAQGRTFYVGLRSDW